MPRLFHPVLWLGLILSSISLLAELSLAQLLVMTWGNAIYMYSLATGIFLGFLGLGALYQFVYPHPTPVQALVAIEGFLALLALSSPIVAIYSSHYALGFVIVIISMAAIGFLNGMEIPLLSAWSESHNGPSAEWILVFDYLGSFVGAVSFPFWYRSLGLWESFLALGSLSLLMGLYFMWGGGVHKSWRMGSYAVLALLLVLGWIFHQHTESYLSYILAKQHVKLF